MLHDVKLRHFDRVTKRETVELVTVDAASGDEAAELAHALRPAALVVGVAPKGGFGEVGGATLEADEAAAVADDEDAEPPPSNRELAVMVARRTLAAVAAEQSLPGDRSLVDQVLADVPVKRGPGRPRKEPQS
jgi:hypothetical protein